MATGRQSAARTRNLQNEFFMRCRTMLASRKQMDSLFCMRAWHGFLFHAPCFTAAPLGRKYRFSHAKNVGKLFRFCITLKHDIDRERSSPRGFAGRNSARLE